MFATAALVALGAALFASALALTETREMRAAIGAPVRWLETQSPQMPARHAYRFARDWNYLTDKLEEKQ